MPFACIYVPNFSVAAVFRAEPELRSQAVAIFGGKPPMEKVFAMNESAGPGRKLGEGFFMGAVLTATSALFLFMPVANALISGAS